MGNNNNQIIFVFVKNIVLNEILYDDVYEYNYLYGILIKKESLKIQYLNK